MLALTRTAIREALSWNREVSGGRRVQALREAAARTWVLFTGLGPEGVYMV